MECELAIFLQSLKDDAEVTPWKQRWRTLEAFWITVLALMHHLLEVTNNLQIWNVNVNSGPKLSQPKHLLKQMGAQFSHCLDQVLEHLGEEGRVVL